MTFAIHFILAQMENTAPHLHVRTFCTSATICNEALQGGTVDLIQDNM